MPRFAADENFSAKILGGLLRRNPDFDILRIQDVGLAGENDQDILQWCADHSRVLISHDVNTMPKQAYDRVKAGQAMPGVLLVRRQAPMRVAIDEILLAAEASAEDEWENQVRYVPLR